MWRGVPSLTDRVRAFAFLRYLLLVPVFVVFTVGTYNLGRSSEIAKPRQLNGEESVHLRARRAVPTIESPSLQPEQKASPTGGAVYTRWGRTECPNGSESVYAGITGGSFFSVHGGGSNPLCLPMDPLWGEYNENVEKASKLYGAEYESPSGFDFANAGGRTLQDHNIPCVVCRSPTRASTLMVPARNICYGDWHVEYTGYLMSSHPGHQGRTQFICVDGRPESDPAGFRDENGALFYNVEGFCGSLPCPPYVQRREIVCAVCTK